MFIVNHKKIFILISAVLVAVSIGAILMIGLHLGVDFLGGSSISVLYEGKAPDTTSIVSSLEEAGFQGFIVRETGASGLNIRTSVLSEGDKEKIMSALTVEGFTEPTIERISSIGPSVGQELRRKTVRAILFVLLTIIAYLAFTFRKISKPVSSWVYGLIAVIALIHDVIIPTGVVAVLGHYRAFDVDTLFVVALLTILGVSVNDTIVVFDRIRENLRLKEERHSKESFAQTVGESLQQTYVRSINTSLTVIFVLLVLFFLGGPTIHNFILILLIGLIAGTYSSICLASPLLVVWGERKIKKLETQKVR
jgi:preprotein translocase subunit SecF